MPTSSAILRLVDAAQHKEPNVIWKSQPRQDLALRCPAFELFFGGARYGGKSDFLLADYAQDVNQWGPAWKGILFRRTYDELTQLIARSHEIYPYIFPGAKYSMTTKTWFFPSRAKLRLRYAKNIEDVHHYQGHDYPWIGWDELPLWADDGPYMLMFGCARSAKGAPSRIRATGNPGGAGTGWVKQRFIEDIDDPLNKSAFKLRRVEIPEYVDTLGRKWPARTFTRCFIPSRLEDNAIAMENNPEYEAVLRMLPEHVQRMWREGDWDVLAGQVFDIFQKSVHVIRPFRIPDAWRKFRGLDWGSTRPFSVGWYAVDTESRLYKYREWYGWNGRPNEGVKLDSRSVARGILEREKEQFDEGKVRYGIADPSIFAKVDGPSIAEKMADEGVFWEEGDKDRLNGLHECYHRLRWKEDGENRPGFLVFENCKHFIRTIPILVYDEKKPEDVDTEQEDHVYDEWRYVCMSRPWRSFTKPQIAANMAASEYRPLDSYAGY